MKKWLLLCGLLSLVLIGCLVFIFFWVGEPLYPLDRTNNPKFLAYFLHMTAFWFLFQAINLIVFWKKFLASAFPKLLSYVFWFISLSFLGLSFIDTYVMYLKTGFWVTWIRVVNVQQQMNFLIQKGLFPLLMLLFLILFISIMVFILIFKKSKPQKVILPLFFSMLILFGIQIACIGLMLFRDSFYVNDSPSYTISQMSDFMPILYFGRVVIYFLTSVYLFYLANLLDKHVMSKDY